MDTHTERIKQLEGMLRECITHIDSLEEHIPMAAHHECEAYKSSIKFGERIMDVLLVAHSGHGEDDA